MSGTTAGIDVTELTQSFKLAKNKREQVQILADLNCRSAFEIAEILEREGAFKGLDMAARQFSNNYHPMAGAQPKRRGAPRAVFDEAEARQMYEEHVPVLEMAQRLGIGRNTVERWIERNHLTRTGMRHGPQTVINPIDELRAKELFDEGLDDLAIAEALGCTINRVVEFRRRTRLLRPRGGNKRKAEDKSMKKEAQPTADAKADNFEQILESVDAEEKPETPQRETPEKPKPLSLGELRRYLTEFLPAVLNEAQLYIDGAPVTEFYGFTVTSPNGVPTVDLLTRRG